MPLLSDHCEEEALVATKQVPLLHLMREKQFKTLFNMCIHKTIEK
jgi:hypothetical protein